MVDEYFVTSTSTIPIEATWKTPYVEPFDSSNTKVNGVRIFFENTLNGYFERVRSIFDFSDYNSVLGWATQSMVTQIPPGKYGEGTVDAPVHTYNQYNPLVGGGASGGGVSFEFKAKRKEGTSDTQNLNLYAATALIEKGSDMI
jgi:hypothetical protein